MKSKVLFKKNLCENCKVCKVRTNKSPFYRYCNKILSIVKANNWVANGSEIYVRGNKSDILLDHIITNIEPSIPLKTKFKTNFITNFALKNLEMIITENYLEENNLILNSEIKQKKDNSHLIDLTITIETNPKNLDEFDIPQKSEILKISNKNRQWLELDSDFLLNKRKISKSNIDFLSRRWAGLCRNKKHMPLLDLINMRLNEYNSKKELFIERTSKGVDVYRSERCQNE